MALTKAANFQQDRSLSVSRSQERVSSQEQNRRASDTLAQECSDIIQRLRPATKKSDVGEDQSKGSAKSGSAESVRTFSMFCFVSAAQLQHGIALHVAENFSPFNPRSSGTYLSQLQLLNLSIKTISGQEAQPTCSTHLCKSH